LRLLLDAPAEAPQAVIIDVPEVFAMGSSPIERVHLADDGVVPNNALPVVVYRGVFGDGQDRAGECITLFNKNGWPNPWRNGIYEHHHYHSTAHEVLGIAAGSARVRLGGEKGESVDLHAGDVVVIPAGVAHKRESATSDLLVIGAYPKGQSPDICRAEAAEHDRAAANVARVALPANDPVKGAVGPLLDYWRR
jgi:uncharacterized protein YjlB